VSVSLKFADRWKVRRSLRDYPLYALPFARSTPALSRAEMDANYRRFQEQKAARLKHLARYLAAFSVELVLAPEAIGPLARWIDRYGGHLVPPGGNRPGLGCAPELRSALCCGEPGWVGDYRGLNVINDIAIFAGEYIISQHQGGQWAMWYGHGEKHDRLTGVFGHPCIFGLRHFGPEHQNSMLMEILDNCCAAHSRLAGRFLVWPQQPENLIRRLNYLAAEPAAAVPAAPKGRKSRETRGAVVRRNGVKIYNAFKGRQSLQFWYALEPNCQAEGSEMVFDIRCLPRKYRSGLVIADQGRYDITLGLSEQQRLFAALDAEREAHLVAIERAVDDGYDFNAAARGNYGQFVRRFIRSMKRGEGA